MKNKISVVINYCTNDERFIRTSIDNALQVSDDIILPISDHLYDGTPENIESIKRLAKEYPQVNIQLYEWNNKYTPRYWHNISRVIGVNFVKNNWVLFLDSDEIIDPELFSMFLDSTIDEYDSYKLACYWYFREPIYQSKQWEDSPVLVRKELINIDVHNTVLEREQMFEALNVSKKRMVTWNEKPMIHHFSWVRTKEAMLKKVVSWGHKNDRNWVDLVEEEFQKPFSGTDFVHNYEYNIVENKFNI
jgi:hypothetical protein